MTEKPYAKREVDEKFSEIQSSLSRIETQTIRTNGRVTTIERWQYTFMGGLSVLTLIVVPLLGWALYTLSNIEGMVQDSTHKAVDAALSAYNIKTQ